MRKKHIPRRMCIVCRAMLTKANLCRLARTREGKIFYDENNVITGKGIYICRKKACIEAFATGRKFRRRFHSYLDEISFETLLEQFGLSGKQSVQYSGQESVVNVIEKDITLQE